MHGRVVSWYVIQLGFGNGDMSIFSGPLRVYIPYAHLWNYCKLKQMLILYKNTIIMRTNMMQRSAFSVTVNIGHTVPFILDLYAQTYAFLWGHFQPKMTTLS